jgi:hypothetical protein
MSVSVVNLTLDKGTDFEATFDVFQTDSTEAVLFNYYGVCKIRKHPSSPKFITCNVGIVSTTGEVVVSLGKTATLELSSGRNYYDVVVTETTTDTTAKIVEGSIIVSDTSSV